MVEKRRGRLKIFLGYVAGVGKTFAMLEHAHAQKRAGVDIVIGYVLTHGRMETERLRQGLQEIPPVVLDYKGTRFEELDVNAVLARHPETVIIDELAHTNLPGLRHPKRYKDIEDILNAGINVYTTLNIQHVESLHEAVSQVTGVEIKERVPDKIVDMADEIELIDLSINELLERLKEGKVYVPEQAVRAIEKFFRPDTLLFLREIALRKAAAIVDVTRTTSSFALGGIKRPLAPKLLASVGPSPFSERVVRSCKRLADLMKAEWHVLSVETVESKLAPSEVQERLQKHLELARALGATVAVIPGESIAQSILDYAKNNSITQIIIGHSMRPWYKRLFKKSPVDELMQSDVKHDIYVISSHTENETKEREPPPKKKVKSWFERYFFVIPALLVLLLSLMLWPLIDLLTPVQLGTIYLLSSAIFALFLDPLPFLVSVALLLTVMEVVVSNDIVSWSKGEPVIFSLVLVLVGVVINQLTTARKKALKIALLQNEEVHALFDMSRDLVSSTTPEQMLTRLNARLRLFIDAEAILYVEEGEHVQKIGKIEGVPFSYIEETAAKWTLDHKEKAGCKTATLPSALGVWYPLVFKDEAIGALGIYCKNPWELEARAGLIESFVHVMTLALARK